MVGTHQGAVPPGEEDGATQVLRKHERCDVHQPAHLHAPTGAITPHTWVVRACVQGDQTLVGRNKRKSRCLLATSERVLTD